MHSVLKIALLASGATAAVVESLGSVPSGWHKVRDAEASEPISLHIAMKQPNMEAFEQAMLEMSDPDHADYGKHLTREELRRRTAPTVETADSVMQWLNGTVHEQDAEWVSLHTTVDKANALLDTTFSWFQADGTSELKLRTLQYSVPDALADHVEMIQPTTRFGNMHRQRSTIFKSGPVKLNLHEHAVAAAGGSCGTQVTPDCLKSLYNIKYTAPANASNLIAFASYLNESARYSDLTKFENALVPKARGQKFQVTTINGGKNDQTGSEDSGEANLDVQYVLGVSHPIPIIEYITGGLGPLVPTADQPSQPGSNEPYLDFLKYMLALPDNKLPQTLSTSYGEEEQSVPKAYALKICNMYMQLGARGVSVLHSSGDSGPGNSCLKASDNSTFFNPTFPAGCPYVTAVGATVGTSPERAVGFSSGGFSIYHTAPSYQKSVVASYVKQISKYSKYITATGRGIPDVSAQGQDFVVFDKGAQTALSGTSASCPAFAGVVGLLNAARKSQGKPPMGFLNPWLYKNSAALRDITAGTSQGCASNDEFGGQGAGFAAVKGWDASTGLGVPIFDKMLAIAAPGVPNQ